MHQASRTRVFVRASRVSSLLSTPHEKREREESPGKFKTIRASASSPFAGRSDATIPLPEYEPLVNNETRVVVLLAAGTRRTRELFERNFHRSHTASAHHRQRRTVVVGRDRRASRVITAPGAKSSRDIVGIACTSRTLCNSKNPDWYRSGS